MVLMFFEVAFGICIGCKIYGMFNKGKVLHCPGEVCEIKDRQEIQKTSLKQVAVLFGFIILLIGLVFFFGDYFTKQPDDLTKVLKGIF